MCIFCNSCGCLDTKALLEILKILLPLGAVALGWFVASSLQDRRERRKEIRSLIDSTKEAIEDLYSLTLEYYSSKNKTPINPISQKMKFKKMIISQYFIIINQAGLKTGGTQEVINFTQLATGEVFETPLYKTRINDIEWQGTIALAANELSLLLDKRYFATFKMKSMPDHTAP